MAVRLMIGVEGDPAKLFSVGAGVIYPLESYRIYYGAVGQAAVQAKRVAHKGTHFLSLGIGLWRCRHSYWDACVPPQNTTLVFQCWHANNIHIQYCLRLLIVAAGFAFLM